MTVKQAHWTWRFDSPPDAVWAAMGDTARFNEAAGFVKHAIREVPQVDGSVRFEADAKIGPFHVRWHEHPVEWVAGRGFRHARDFANGPFRSMVATLVLTQDGATTRADYTLAVEPRGFLGHAILAAGFFRQTGAKFERLVADAARFAAGQADVPFAPPPARIPAAGRERLTSALRKMTDAGADRAIADRLISHVADGSEIDLARIRPLGLARRWQTAPRATIETCLRAVKAGMLDLRWDLLCPNCRGAKRSVGALDELPVGAHCDTCNIDYKRDFARNVELTFHPAPAIRAIDEGQFCLFGPMTTPHVIIQQTLAPGEGRDVAVDLAPGAYRARGLHPVGEALIDHAGAFPAVIASDAGIAAGVPSAPGQVRLENRRATPLTLVIESRAWVADALTADRATAMQAFRDLFATEALRPGDDVKIARIALMFTDLRGSTALYTRIGDGAAYRLVREHYAFLADTVRRHDGGVVKTIGDAMMAAFPDPADAARAALELQARVAEFNRAQALGEAGIVIKLGLHVGPAIAVTLNDRLDYFGSTVNLAARLQGESQGGDVVMSAEFAADPGVAAAIGPVRQTRERAAFKGFAEAIPFLRLLPGG